MDEATTQETSKSRGRGGKSEGANNSKPSWNQITWEIAAETPLVHPPQAKTTMAETSPPIRVKASQANSADTETIRGESLLQGQKATKLSSAYTKQETGEAKNTGTGGEYSTKSDSEVTEIARVIELIHRNARFSKIKSLVGLPENARDPSCFAECPCEDEFPAKGQWDRQTRDYYLKQVDSYRTELKGQCIGLPNLKCLQALFNELLEIEYDEKRSFWLLLSRIDDIIHTRLDKLVEEILKAAYTSRIKLGSSNLGTSEEAVTFFVKEIVPKAQQLQQKWQREYNGEYVKNRKYAAIDKMRLKDMKVYGALRHVALNPGYKQGSNLFIIKAPSPTRGSMLKAKSFGKQGFTAGGWYLNIWCAARDGIVGNTKHIVTEGSPGQVTALALLTGTEVEGSAAGTYEYTSESTDEDINCSVQRQKGLPIRLLRGHRLQSRYAPEVGIRFDGLYTFDGEVRKVVESPITYRLKLTLTHYHRPRCAAYPYSNPPHADLSLVPYPSQLDVWKLYADMVAEWMKTQDTADGEKKA